MSAPEGEVPPRVTLYWWPNGVYEYDLCRYSSECIDVPMLSVAEHEQLLSAEKQRGLIAVEEAIALVNEVQQLLASYTTNSSEMLSGVRAAFNLNARYLSKNFEAQTRYLAEQSRAPKEPS